MWEALPNLWRRLRRDGVGEGQCPLPARSGGAPSVPSGPVLALLAAMALIASASTRVMDALLPPISAEYGSSVGEFGFVLAAFAIGYAISQPLLGGLGDRFGKLEVLGAGALAAAAFLALSGTADSVGELALWRAATGATAAPIVALSLAYLGEKTVYADRQTALSRLMGGVMIGQIGAAAIAGVIVEIAGWRAVFFGLGALSAACAAALLFGVATGRISPSSRLARYDPIAPFRLLGRPNVRWLLVLTSIEGATFFAAAGFVGALLSHRFGLSYAVIGFILSGYGIGGLIFVLSARRLHKHLTEPQSAMLGGGLASLSYGLIAVAPWPGAVFGLLAVTGFGFYLMHTVLQARATEMAPDARGASLANFAFSMFLGQSLGAPALGFAIERVGFAVSFLAASVGVAWLTFALVRALKARTFDPRIRSSPSKTLY